MKRFSKIASTLLVVAFLFNINTIFNYEVTEVKSSPYKEPESSEESKDDWEKKTTHLDMRPSIQSYTVSGNLNDMQLSFNTSVEHEEEGVEVTEEDNKKIFFFGKIDPQTEQPIQDDNWDNWVSNSNNSSYDLGSNLDTQYNSGLDSEENSESQDFTEPLIVNYERFLLGE